VPSAGSSASRRRSISGRWPGTGSVNADRLCVTARPRRSAPTRSPAGVVTGAPLLVDVNPNQTLTFAYTTANFADVELPRRQGRGPRRLHRHAARGWTRRRSAPASFTIDMPTQFALQLRRTRRTTSRRTIRCSATRTAAGRRRRTTQRARAAVAISEVLFALSRQPRGLQVDDDAAQAPGSRTRSRERALAEPGRSVVDVARRGERLAQRGSTTSTTRRRDDFTDQRSAGFAGARRGRRR